MARLFRILQFIALFVAVGLVVVLAGQVRGLRSDLSAIKRRALFPQAGDLVPPFDATTLDGLTIHVGEGAPGSRQLLMVFNTKCPICLKTAPEWNRLDSLVRGIPDLTALGWSQHPDSLTRPYVAEHGFRFPVVIPDRRWLRPYKVEGVPNTLVIASGGRVLWARTGALTEEAVDSAVVFARGG
jgi:hypothetical protein